MVRLEGLGLREETTDALEEFRRNQNVRTDTQLGRVARVDRGEVDVMTEEGLLRVVSDSQRAQGVTAPVTGDWVVVAPDEEVGMHVAQVLPRRTAMVRRDPAEQVSDQVLVANIDRVAVVHGLDQESNDARIERFLVLAIDSGADPLIVLTKSDLGEVTTEYDWLDSVAPVIATSAVDGSGIDELRSVIAPGETLVFIGPSGVGKSSLVNAIVGNDVAATAEVREGDRRGRHTTTVRELIEIPTGGVLIDTPGIRAIGLWAADIALDEVFADIAALAQGCRFRDCTHRQEPDCAVTQAVHEALGHNQPTEPPSGHREVLGEAVHDQHVVVVTQCRCCGTAVGEPVVDLVRHHGDVALGAPRKQRLQRLAVEHRAGRIRRARDDQSR